MKKKEDNMQKERATQIRRNWIETACTKTKMGTNKMQISSKYEPQPSVMVSKMGNKEQFEYII